jgi:hypothetical protein
LGAGIALGKYHLIAGEIDHAAPRIPAPARLAMR